MKVKNGIATATLTELKNKIGDVFTLVDKNGEVTITSYNKPAYKIVKIEREVVETSEVEAEAKALAAPRDPEPLEQPIPQHNQMAQPNIEVQIFQPEVVNMPAANTPLVPNPLVAESTPAVEASQDSKQETEQAPQVLNETNIKPGILAHVSVGELWNRAGAKEQEWVQITKNLF